MVLIEYDCVIDFRAVCTLCTFSYILLSLSNVLPTNWDIATHSAHHMLSI